MRQKVAVAVLVLVVVFGLLGKAFAGRDANVCIVDGYLPGQFSLKGVVEQKTEDCITRMQALQIAPSEQLVVAVVGSADASGQTSENDWLGLERAEQVSARLATNFPNTLIRHWSAGDNEDIRKVTVVFSVEKTAEVAAKTEDPKASSAARNFLLVLMAFFLISLAVSVIPRKKEKPKSLESIKKKNLPTRQEIIVSGYRVPVEYHDGCYWSPFYSKNGNQISRGTMDEIRHSLKGCLAKSEFVEQKNSLLKNGAIVNIGIGVDISSEA